MENHREVKINPFPDSSQQRALFVDPFKPFKLPNQKHEAA
jgi:hypothetical protein